MKKCFQCLITLTVLLMSLYSCGGDSKQKKINHDHEFSELSPNRSNLNISVLLDLSDRISPEKYPSPSMEYYQRDVGYLKSIAEHFEVHILNKKVINIDDKIQVFLDPEPFDKSLNEKLVALRTYFDRNNAHREEILNICKKYDSISELIYKAAIKDANYVGSDTWSFFKNKVNDYCLKQGYRNVLIILTDGYIYHENTKIREGNRTTYLTPEDVRRFSFNQAGWKDKFEEQDFGFIKANEDLRNLEVLVLGINPDDKNPFEEDVIRVYWGKWFEEMGVRNYQIRDSDLPVNMAPIIAKFLWHEEKEP